MTSFIGKEVHCISSGETQRSLVRSNMVRTWANRSLLHGWKFGDWGCLARPSRVHFSADGVTRHQGLVLVTYHAKLMAPVRLVEKINSRCSLCISARVPLKFWWRCDIYAVCMLLSSGRKFGSSHIFTFSWVRLAFRYGNILLFSFSYTVRL